MTIMIYGIRHCDTMKKAFAWLDAQGLSYVFHDFKKTGVEVQALRQWAEIWGWESLINRKGTTWRRLSEADRAVADAESAFLLMQAHPSMIRRPILIADEKTLLGFDAVLWSATLQP
ncbi:MAG: arsenate reductase [Acidithiobacillus sp.]